MKKVKKFAKKLLKWIVTRGVEPTTWLGMGALAGLFGFSSPEWSALAYKFAGASAAVAMILGEKSSKPNPGDKIKTD